jgi:peroxiredoxin family protein
MTISPIIDIEAAIIGFNNSETNAMAEMLKNNAVVRIDIFTIGGLSHNFNVICCSLLTHLLCNCRESL